MGCKIKSSHLYIIINAQKVLGKLKKIQQQYSYKFFHTTRCSSFKLGKQKAPKSNSSRGKKYRILFQAEIFCWPSWKRRATLECKWKPNSYLINFWFFCIFIFLLPFSVSYLSTHKNVNNKSSKWISFMKWN